MKFNFNANYESVKKEYNLEKGQYFKLSEGANRVRLISECLPHQSFYKNQLTFKWLCQVIDRKDGIVKPFFMANTIYRQIESLQMSEDYAFTEVPMPYDMTINAKGAGTKEVVYTTTPARNNTPLTEEDKKAIAEAPTVQELQQKIRDNEKEGTQIQNTMKGIAPAHEEMPDDFLNEIPFAPEDKK